MQVMIKDDEIEAANLVRKQLTCRKGDQRVLLWEHSFLPARLSPKARYTTHVRNALAPEISLQCL